MNYGGHNLSLVGQISLDQLMYSTRIHSHIPSSPQLGSLLFAMVQLEYSHESQIRPFHSQVHRAARPGAIALSPLLMETELG